MARPIVLSNGNIFVGLDNFGLVNDFYFPYVGQDNLTNARNYHHKIGIWIDGVFTWVNDSSWRLSINYVENSLVSYIKMDNDNLNISLEFNDYIDPVFNSFIRHIKINNKSDRKREIRLFMHQVFVISASGRADTVLYVPDKNYIYNYKGRVSLLINGKFIDGTGFDQYSTGNYHIEGKLGTYKDAEDGELSNNPVEHASVDSTIRFKKILEANSNTELDYWIIAGEDQNSVSKINDNYMMSSMIDRLKYSQKHWLDWTSKIDTYSFRHKSSAIKSLLIIKAHIDNRGSIIASGDSSIYNYGRDYYAYCWPRDASYALWPLIRLGYFEEAKNFFNYCIKVLHPDGYLLHKYQPDQSVGSTWHSLIINNKPILAIQEDETAIVLFILEQFLKYSNDVGYIESIYQHLIVPAANFLSSYIDIDTGLPHASFDLWEEKFLTTTYTVSTVIAGLRSAIKIAGTLNKNDEHISKWKESLDTIIGNFDKLYDNDTKSYAKGFVKQMDGSLLYDKTIDISSIYGPYMFAKISIHKPRMKSTLQAIETKLKNTLPNGGVLRYFNDNYFLSEKKYPGNPWIVATLWLSQVYLANNEKDKALDLLNWCLEKETSSGNLSEQYNPRTNEAVGVDPLVWSQVELINTILDFA